MTTDTIKKVLSLMPVQLLLIIVAVLCLGENLPHPIARGLYTVSLLIKDAIMLILPAAIAAFIASTLMQFQKRALMLVVLLIIFEGISNATSVLYAYAAGLGLNHLIPMFETIPNQDFQLVPFFQIWKIQSAWWSSTNGVMFGAILGLTSAFHSFENVTRCITTAQKTVGFIFSQILMRLMPAYVLGFLIFMQHSGLLDSIVETYGMIIGVITLCIAAYLLLIFSIATYFGKQSLSSLFKTILPTGFIAATSMSSMATMPFTIAAAEKNLRTPGFAQMLIPATTNIQQVGDCIANAFLCLVILKNFGHPMPDFTAWLLFMSVFTLARYTTAAVMGGAIYLMIPIYKATLGFTDDMVAIILALNIVLDPIITASNVMANGGLAIIFESLWLRLSRKKNSETTQTN
jgi:Na+/H+-dicarboxylate symporter